MTHLHNVVSVLPQSKCVILILAFKATVDQRMVRPSIMVLVDGTAEVEWVTPRVANRCKKVLRNCLTMEQWLETVACFALMWFLRWSHPVWCRFLPDVAIHKGNPSLSIDVWWKVCSIRCGDFILNGPWPCPFFWQFV